MESRNIVDDLHTGGGEFEAARLSSKDPYKTTEEWVNKVIDTNRVVIFSKTTCPFCDTVKRIFEKLSVQFLCVEIDAPNSKMDLKNMQLILLNKTNQRTVPNVFIDKNHVGGHDDTYQAWKSGMLEGMLQGKPFGYDVAVIGGGSGGIAAAKEAARLGKKVVLFDFVKPSPHGVTWGLGGTCVNVGCIPKKLMHKAAILGEDLKDAENFGWPVQSPQHDWSTMVEKIQDYIKSLNFKFKTDLRQKGVEYINGYASFVDQYHVQSVDKKGNTQNFTAKKFIIAIGGRPKYPDIPGKHFGISSDDLFSLKRHPGKTLIVGASYIALECAGFLAGLGVECHVMVRSILLRGFDQDMANKLGSYMKKNGVNFIRDCHPTGIEKVADGTSEKLPELKVTGITTSENKYEGIFNTVIFAVGREACTNSLALEKVPVKVHPETKKIYVDSRDTTTIKNIFAIGDCAHGKLELTPVAIQAGRLLAQRIACYASLTCDYENVPTTVFTPLEYGCVGLSEEAAVEKYGKEQVDVYHTYFHPLEYELTTRQKNACYGKLVCEKSTDVVVGFHVLAPNAGEITQGYALGIKLKAKKSDFANLIGIHPTCAEWFTVMGTTKASGIDVTSPSC